MEMTVENVKIADLMALEGAEEATKKIEEILAADEEVSALAGAAKSVEDAFAAVKKYIQLTLDEFKVVFQKAVDYFRDDKEVIGDEVLDCVSGGGFWSNLWDKVKKPLLAVTVFTCCVAGGALAGCAAGLPGMIAGAVMGAVGGACGAIAIMLDDKKK